MDILHYFLLAVTLILSFKLYLLLVYANSLFNQIQKQRQSRKIKLSFKTWQGENLN